MTSAPMDFDGDRDAEIARRIEEQARDTAERAASAASDAQEALDAVITEAGPSQDDHERCYLDG